jgi:hypothetical protein
MASRPPLLPGGQPLLPEPLSVPQLPPPVREVVAPAVAPQAARQAVHLRLQQELMGRRALVGPPVTHPQAPGALAPHPEWMMWSTERL